MHSTPEARSKSREASILGGAGTPRILVVDDERDVREMMVDLFEGDGYEVVAAATLNEAQEALEGPELDAIITDLKLGHQNGLELLRSARERDPDAIVILVTGFASVRTAIDALRDGAYDYIQKPFDLDRLSAVLERGLDARRLVRENRRLVVDLRHANEALLRHEDELEERVRDATRRLHDLLAVGREVTSDLDRTKTLDMVVDRAVRLVRGKSGFFFALKDATGDLAGEAAAPFGDWPAHVPRSVLDGLLYDVMLTGQARRWQRGDRIDAFLSSVDASSALAVPLGFQEAVVGVLVVVNAERGAFSVEDEEQLALFALQASNAVGNASVHGRLKDVERLKSDFVAMVSHEIRTPITAIQGILELLRGASSEDRDELLEIGEINARRLLTIVSDILDFSKLEASRLPMTFGPTSIRDVIESVAQSIKHIASDAGITIDTSFAHELPVVLADRVRVEQVLTNLISNAIKFSSPGDSVFVSAERTGEVVRIAVKDEGCGIDEADIPKLFTKLAQLDMGASRTQGGTGLGLVISRAIVEAHGGEIFVQSEKGHGSEFEFQLPIEPPEGVRRSSGALRTAER